MAIQSVEHSQLTLEVLGSIPGCASFFYNSLISEPIIIMSQNLQISAKISGSAKCAKYTKWVIL